jgi:hypothetical protein
MRTDRLAARSSAVRQPIPEQQEEESMRAIVFSTLATLGLGVITTATCGEETEVPAPSPGAQQVTPESRQAAGPPSEHTQVYARPYRRH